MDCLQAAELISAAADGELRDAAQLSEARKHSASCPECRRLELLLARLASVPATAAPDNLVAQLESLAADAARDQLHEPDALLASQPLKHHHGGRWTPRFTALASAAAVLLIALTAGSVALLGQFSTPQEAADRGEATLMEKSAPAVGGADGATAENATAAAQDSMAVAPGYVVYNGVVWVRIDLPSTTELREIGLVTSDLGTGAVTEHSAYIGADPEVLYVQSDGPEMLAFRPVVRTVSGAEYVLVSDAPLPTFGGWPTFPTDVPQPLKPDGSMAFVRWGIDDHGRDVFRPSTAAITDGLAIAPGTPADDPAAGNPNWTWWELRR